MLLKMHMTDYSTMMFHYEVLKYLNVNQLDTNVYNVNVLFLISTNLNL